MQTSDMKRPLTAVSTQKLVLPIVQMQLTQTGAGTSPLGQICATEDFFLALPLCAFPTLGTITQEGLGLADPL